MQLMILDSFHTHGLKSTQSNMQSDLDNLDSAPANALKNFGGKVQSGRRCSHRSPHLCIDRLVANAIRPLIVAMLIAVLIAILVANYVGRQGRAQCAPLAQKNPPRGKSDRPFAKVAAGDDFRL